MLQYARHCAILPTAVFRGAAVFPCVRALRWASGTPATDVATPAAVPESRARKLLGDAKESVAALIRGTRDLSRDTVQAAQVRGKMVMGKPISRDDYRLVKRNSRDLLMTIPLSVVVALPGPAAVYIPFVVKFFPNFMPATFVTPEQKEMQLTVQWESRKTGVRALSSYLTALSGLSTHQLQGRVVEHAHQDLVHTIVDPDPVMQQLAPEVVTAFRLKNLDTPQLKAVCRLFSVTDSLGSKSQLIKRMRTHYTHLRKDDALLLQMGIDGLDEAHLREACNERGMKVVAANPALMRAQLRDWLDRYGKAPPRLHVLVLERIIDAVTRRLR